jgi:hypothetical protein
VTRKQDDLTLFNPQEGAPAVRAPKEDRMGFKQRERNRKAKAAKTRAQAAGRRDGSSAGRWWLTIASKTTCCARCGHVLREGRELVYRHTPREARCLRCATVSPDSAGYGCSLRWEAWRKEQLKSSIIAQATRRDRAESRHVQRDPCSRDAPTEAA